MIKTRAFIDESSTEEHNHREIFSMGGWIADVDTWERFTDEWYEELRKTPAITYFKHSEAKAQDGQFTGWTEEESDRKIMSLARVIHRVLDPEKQQYGYLTGLKPQILRNAESRAVAHRKQIRRVFKMAHSYDFCFHSIIPFMLGHQLLFGKNDVVDFIFDRNNLFSSCEKWFNKMRPKLPKGIIDLVGTLTQGKDEELAPLQAADLMVGQATYNLKNQKPDQPFQLLAASPGIRFRPITLHEQNSTLQMFANLIDPFNYWWTGLRVQKSKKP